MPKSIETLEGADAEAFQTAIEPHVLAVLAEEGQAQGKIENFAAMRGFFSALDALSSSDDAVVLVNAYGDSVSPDLAAMFADQLARDFVGAFGISSFSDQWLSSAIATPTGMEPSARWPSSGQPAYALAGGASFSKQADGAAPDAVYLPNNDQHWVVPNGGSVTFTLGLAGSNIRRALVFLAKEPGAGSATVELINEATSAVITTTVVGSLANATIDATHADFAALDTTLGYKLKVTCTAGSIRVLGVVGLRRRCVLTHYWSWGGSYLQQQNRSSNAVFTYINTVLAPAITFVETRGETPTEFAGAGIGGDATDGIANTCARLAAIGGSKVLVGGRPTVTVVNDDAQTALYRAAARAHDFVFIDGVAMLKDNAALAAIGWNKKNGVVDNVHLPKVTAGFIAGQLISMIPFGHVRNLWNCRKVVTAAVISDAVGVRPNNLPDDSTGYVSCLVPYGLNVALGKLQNVANVTIKNPNSAATCSLDMFGTALRPSCEVDLANGKWLGINGSILLKGQKSGWALPSGTLTRTTFDPASATLVDVAQRLAALITDLYATPGGNVQLLKA